MYVAIGSELPDGVRSWNTATPFEALDEAVRVMGRVQLGRDLEDNQVADIVAFLQSLNGELPEHARLPEDETPPSRAAAPAEGEAPAEGATEG